MGGTGNWSDDANHWATASGGAAGAGNKPGTTDTAIFDASSGGGTATLNEAVSIAAFDMQTGNTTAVTTSGSNYGLTTSGNFTITAGTFTANGSTITVGGNWSNSGTFTDNLSTVTFNGASGTILITPGGTDANHDFYNIIFNDAAGTATYQLQGDLKVNNDLTITDGILDTKSGSNYAITVGRDWLQNGGRCTAQSSIITVGRHFTANGAESETGYNNATVVLTGTGNLTYSNLASYWANGFSNLTVGQNGNTTTHTGGSLRVFNILSVGSGVLAGGNNMISLAAAAPLSLNANANFTGGTLTFQYVGTITLAPLVNGYYTIRLDNDNTILSQSGDMLIKGSLNITGSEWPSRSSTYITNGYNLTVSGTVRVGVGNDTGLKTLDASTAGGRTTTITVGGNWTVYDTGTAPAVFIAGNSTVILNGTTNQTVATGGDAFNNLTLNNTGTDGTANDDIVISGLLDVNGNLTITNGQLRLDTNNPNVTVAGNMSIASAGSLTKGTGTLTFDGTTVATYTDSTAAIQNLGILSINKTDTVAPSTNNKLTLNSTTTVDTLTIDGTSGSADTLDLGSGGYTLTLANAGATPTVFTNSGALTPGTSTVKYSATNSGGNINVTAAPYNSLQISGAETYDLAGNLTGANAMTGNLTIDTGATLDATSANNYNLSAVNVTINGTYTARASTITASGNWDSSTGTFTYDTSTVVMTGASNMITTPSSGNFYDTRFYKLTINSGAKSTVQTGASANGFAASNLLTISGELSVPTGKIASAISSGNLVINTGGVLSGAGTFCRFGTNSSSLIVNNGTISINTFVYSNSGNSTTLAPVTATTYNNNLTIESSNNVNSAGIIGAGNLNVGGTLTIRNATGGGGYTTTVDNSTNNTNITAGGLIIGTSGVTTKYGKLIAGSATITINGNVTVYASDASGANEIDAGSSTWNITGNFTNNDVFTPGTSTVNFTGANKSISGITSFYNLTKSTTTATTLTFPASATTTVSGTLTLNGAVGQLLSLRSSTSGTPWGLNLTGSVSGSYLDIKDSNASYGSVVSAATSTDSGNNTNWRLLNSFVVDAPATTNSGTAFSTTITVKDAAGNTTKSVSGNTTLSVSAGLLDTTSLAASQFTDDGIWTGNLTISGITEQSTVILTATNGTATGADSVIVSGTSTAPLIGSGSALSSTSIRWSFTDNSSYETGFRLYDNIGALASSSAVANLTYLDETGLSPNTQYSGRYVTGYNAVGASASSSVAAAIYTLANQPTGLSLTVDSQTQITANWSANSNPNNTEYYIENTTAGTNSGWTTSTSWASSGLGCSNNYSFKVKARNGNGIETEFTNPATVTTAGCGGGIIMGLIQTSPTPAPLPKPNEPEPQKTSETIVEIIKSPLAALKSLTPGFFKPKPMEVILPEPTPPPVEIPATIKPFSTLEEIKEIVLNINIQPKPPSVMLKKLEKQTSYQLAKNIRQLKDKFNNVSQSVRELGGLLRDTPSNLKHLAADLFNRPILLVNGSAGDIKEGIVGLGKGGAGLVRNTAKFIALEFKNVGGKIAGIGKPLNYIAVSQPKPSAAPALPAQETEKLVFKSSYGDIYLPQKENAVASLVGLSVKSFIKPKSEKVKSIITEIYLQKMAAKDFKILKESAARDGWIKEVQAEELLEFQGDRAKFGQYSYTKDQDGIWSASIITPAFAGEYELKTIIEYVDGENKELSNLLIVKAKGWVYRSHPEGQIRLQDGKVELYYFNSQNHTFELWPAGIYNQRNPQITGSAGEYSFFLPKGRFYLSASKDGYLPFESEEFEVTEPNILNLAIELEKM